MCVCLFECVCVCESLRLKAQAEYLNLYDSVPPLTLDSLFFSLVALATSLNYSSR